MKHFLFKKDRGIALIFSLFFLVLLFAVGLALLFRAQLNKKTATAMTNNELDKIKIEGALSIVGNTISYAMKDKSSTSFDATFGTTTGGSAELHDERTLRSSGLKSASNQLDGFNDNSANIAGNSTLAAFRSFHHDGSNNVTIDNTEWLVFNKEGELIDQNNPTDVETGDRGFRLAYYVIDQTGKINPNTAVHQANNGESGLSFEALYKSESTPFNLRSISPNSADSLFDRITNSYTYKEVQDVAEIAQYSSDRTTLYQNLYPYGVTIDYPEIPKSYGPTQPSGYPSERLNLHSIYDGTLFTDADSSLRKDEFSKDDEKIEVLIDSLPFLINLKGEKEEASKRQADTDFDGSTDTIVENVDLATKVAANLKDYIDDDVIATTNLEFDATGRPKKWVDQPGNNGDEVYVGHEGVSLTGASFLVQSMGTGRTRREGGTWDLETRTVWPSGYAGGLYAAPIHFVAKSVNYIQLNPLFEVTVDIDLKDTSLVKQDVNPHWNPATKDATHPLLVYYNYNARYKVARTGSPNFTDPPTEAEKYFSIARNDSSDPLYRNPFNTDSALDPAKKEVYGEYYKTDIEHVVDIWHFNEVVYSQRNQYGAYNKSRTLMRKFGGGFPQEISFNDWNGTFNGVLFNRGTYSNFNLTGGAMSLYGKHFDHNNIGVAGDPIDIIRAGIPEGTIPDVTGDTTGVIEPLFDPFNDERYATNSPPTPNIDPTGDAALGHHPYDLCRNYVAYDVELEFERPIVLFFDIDGDRLPDKEEIVDVIQLPTKTADIGQKGHSANYRLTGDPMASGMYSQVRFHPIGDPRDNTHSNDWRQYSGSTNEPAVSDRSLTYIWENLEESNLNSSVSVVGMMALNDLGGIHYSTRDFYRSWAYQDQLDNEMYDDAGGYPYPDVQNETPLTEQDLTLSYHNTAFHSSGGVDQEPFYDGSTYRAIDHQLQVSSMSHPFNPATGQFGGIRTLAELGKVSRGEDWRTLNLTFTQLPTSTVASENKYTDFDDPRYTPKYLDSNQHETNLYSDANVKYTGGDGRILNEVYIEAAAGTIPGLSSEINTREAISINSPVNPNSKNTAAFKSLLSSIKVPFTVNTSGDNYFNNNQKQAGNTAGISNQKITQVSSNLDNTQSKIINTTKLDQFISNFESQLNTATTAPFDRKYTYSHDPVGSPSDERFNPMDVRRLVSNRLGQAFAYNTNSASTPFADVTKFSPFNDLERETLFLESKKFMSIRYHHFSAIILYEPFRFTPDNISNSSSDTVNIANGFDAKIQTHYRVRAELVHDLFTNQTKVLTYRLLN